VSISVSVFFHDILIVVVALRPIQSSSGSFDVENSRLP
jgi:hypothetical protein